MAEEAAALIENDVSDEVISRIYEVGYHIVPTVAEENAEKIVGDIRGIIEKAGGSFIAEGAPALTRLAYLMDSKVGDKRVPEDRGYFGWIKFEAAISAAGALDQALKANASILRYIIFKTVREETRARVKLATVREVKRTDVIKAAPRRVEEESAPVSEEELEKAISDITTE